MQERRRLVEFIKNGEMMRTIVSMTHGRHATNTDQHKEKAKKLYTNVVTQKHGRFKKRTVQLGHLVLFT